MDSFEKWICDNKELSMRVTKLRNLNQPINHTSDIPLGEGFTGQVTLKHFPDSDWGSGFVILVNGGYTMRTSLVREVICKEPNKWLARTLNSVYRIEIIK